MTNDDLKARLREVESDPIGCGLVRNWHRNPEGPAALEYIEQLERERNALRRFVADFRDTMNVDGFYGDAPDEFTARANLLLKDTP